MNKHLNCIGFLILLLLLVVIAAGAVEPQQSCRPSGKIRGRKPPPGGCNKENQSECCKNGRNYVVYECSPPVTNRTKAVLTLNSFEKNGDGGGPSECDNKYHPDDLTVVSLSTGWFGKRKRCHNYIKILGNGKSVKAMVVDECDSTKGCDKPMTISHRVKITLLMPLKLFGRH